MTDNLNYVDPISGDVQVSAKNVGGVYHQAGKTLTFPNSGQLSLAILPKLT